MLYHEITIGGKDDTEKKNYKFRLGAHDAILLEKKLGKNPLNLLVDMEVKGEVLDTEVIVNIMFYALNKYQHGISIADVENIYDTLVDEGKDYTYIFKEIITPIFVVSGYFKMPVEDSKEIVAQEDSKN